MCRVVTTFAGTWWRECGTSDLLRHELAVRGVEFRVSIEGVKVKV